MFPRYWFAFPADNVSVITTICAHRMLFVSSSHPTYHCFPSPMLNTQGRDMAMGVFSWNSLLIICSDGALWILGKGSPTDLHTQVLSLLILTIYSITWKHHLLTKGKFNYGFNEDQLRDMNKNASGKNDCLSQQYLCLICIFSAWVWNPVHANASGSSHHST